MRERKISLWLSRLGIEEQDLFLTFLASPLHSKRPKLADLIGLLLQNVIRKSGTNCSAEEFWLAFYPDRPYNANLLSRLLSEAVHEFKQFIALRKFQEDPGSANIQRLRWLRQQGWEDVIPAALNETQKKLDKDLPRDEHYHYCKFQLATQRAEYDLEHLGKSPGPIYQDCHDQLDHQYLLSKIKLWVQAKNHDRMHSTDHKTRDGFVQDLILDLDISPNTPLIFLYSLWHKTVDVKGNIELFQTFQRELINLTPDYNQASLPRLTIQQQEIRPLFLLAVNFAIQNLNRNKREWGRIFYELNDIGIRKGALLEKGQISGRYFMNAVGIISRFSGYDNCSTFIETYGPLIDSDPDQTIEGFSHAANFFYDQQMENCKKKLLQVKNKISSRTDLGIILNTRSMLCRVWFETGDWEGFIHEVHAFRNYLNREKRFSRKRLENHRVFCAYALKLERIARGDPKTKARKLSDLYSAVSQLSEIALKSWFLNAIKREQ